MDISKIPVGVNPPEGLDVIIDVPTAGEPVKGASDKASGARFVDQILHTAMHYPANHGFVPHPRSNDGDPINALLINRSPFFPAAWSVPARSVYSSRSSISSPATTNVEFRRLSSEASLS